jgi:hypothetical protein
MAKQELPETEYHVVKITGHGYKFMPPKKTTNSRGENTEWGYLVGVAMIWGTGVKFRTVDLNPLGAQPGDRGFRLGEEPTLEECSAVIPRLQRAFPLMEERVLVVWWEDGKFGKPRQFLELAPRDFVIPTVSKDTMPENTAKEEPAREHLTATIGESTKVLSRKKQRKLALQTPSET